MKRINTKNILIFFICIFIKLNTIGQECKYSIVIFFSDETSIQTGLGGIRLRCDVDTLPSGLIPSYDIYKPRMSFVEGIAYRHNAKSEVLVNKILKKLRHHKFNHASENNQIPDEIEKLKVKDGWTLLIWGIDDSFYPEGVEKFTVFEIIPHGNIFKRLKIHCDNRVMKRIEKWAVKLKNVSTEEFRISPKPKRSINLSLQKP